ncbi:MAG: PEF-CTERM sorting domain-containing protein [Candidatus Methanoperedens sp.]|nr:PEF-CTERM sorting domain-containing protein [Candidatus Methanoperedens sp.]
MVKIKISKLLLMVVIVSCVFTGVASSERFTGEIYGNDGKPISEKNVVIQKSDWGIAAEINEGKYDKRSTIPTSRYAKYDMKIDGVVIQTKELTPKEWEEETYFDFKKWWFVTDYKCNWDYNKNPTDPSQIPEFPAVALPVAAVIGIVFFFQQRREKK